MFELEFVNIGLNGEFHSLMMGPKTASGDKVECPIGLSYSCADSGVFKSNMTLSMSGKVKFPGWRMQVRSLIDWWMKWSFIFIILKVFEVKRGKFGPMWECGELLSIGLWVGILVTLGFALICAWGFTMLASINVSTIIANLLLQLILNFNLFTFRRWTDLMIPREKQFTFRRQQIKHLSLFILKAVPSTNFVE